jgi:hypothetical protein
VAVDEYIHNKIHSIKKTLMMTEQIIVMEDHYIQHLTSLSPAQVSGYPNRVVVFVYFTACECKVVQGILVICG